MNGMHFIMLYKQILTSTIITSKLHLFPNKWILFKNSMV